MVRERGQAVDGLGAQAHPETVDQLLPTLLGALGRIEQVEAAPRQVNDAVRLQGKALHRGGQEHLPHALAQCPRQ